LFENYNFTIQQKILRLIPKFSN